MTRSQKEKKRYLSQKEEIKLSCKKHQENKKQNKKRHEVIALSLKEGIIQA